MEDKIIMGKVSIHLIGLKIFFPNTKAFLIHLVFSELLHISGLNNWVEFWQEANEGGKKETPLMERPHHTII